MQPVMLAMNLEELKTILVVVQLVVSVGMAWLLAVVNGKTKRIDTLESERNKLVDELKRATGDVIDQKLGLVTHRVTTIEQRLLTGDAHLKRLDDRDHDIRVEVLKAISELKDLVATKDDLRELRKEMSEHAK